MRPGLQRWSADDIERVRVWRSRRVPLRVIAPLLGRTHPALKAMVEREGIRAAPPARMTPSRFAARCRKILTTLKGHARHQAFDQVCEEALEAAGYAEGVALFEAAVRNWHGDHHPYPYGGPCPDCESLTPPPPKEPGQ